MIIFAKFSQYDTNIIFFCISCLFELGHHQLINSVLYENLLTKLPEFRIYHGERHKIPRIPDADGGMKC